MFIDHAYETVKLIFEPLTRSPFFSRPRLARLTGLWSGGLHGDDERVDNAAVVRRTLLLPQKELPPQRHQVQQHPRQQQGPGQAS